MKGLLLVSLFALCSVSAAADVSDVKLSRRWRVLFMVNQSTVLQDLPDEFVAMSAIGSVKFEGPHSDVNLLGKFETDGVYALGDGYVHRQVGGNALLELPAGDAFDLEGIVDAGDLGGFLMLLGWDRKTNSGVAVYSCGMRSSGDPWRLCQIKNGKVVAGSDRLILKKKMAGEGAFRVRVDKKHTLTLALGDQVILMNVPLPGYSAGSVMIGSYSAGYGGKNFRFRSLRMRSH